MRTSELKSILDLRICGEKEQALVAHIAIGQGNGEWYGDITVLSKDGQVFNSTRNKFTTVAKNATPGGSFGNLFFEAEADIQKIASWYFSTEDALNTIPAGAEFYNNDGKKIANILFIGLWAGPSLERRAEYKGPCKIDLTNDF